ncbi:MAG: hypothetical protein ACLQVD_03215 [Capsulimonadaceae bacterium]
MDSTVKSDRKVNGGLSVAKAGSPAAQFEVRRETDTPDPLSLRVSRQTMPMRVVVLTSGELREVRDAVRQARLAKSAFDRRERILVSARSLAQDSRKWLQCEGISYVDSVGHLFIAADGVLRGDEKKASVAEDDTCAFRGRSTRVLHALLHTPARDWHFPDLAREAGVCIGTAYRVCDSLEKMQWMERVGRSTHTRRRVTQPGGILDAWTEHHTLADYHLGRFYHPQADLDALALVVASCIESQGHSYAATLGLGARSTTHIDQVTLLVPPGVDLARLAAEAGLKTVDEGANVVLLWSSYDTPLMYRQCVQDLWTANDIQLYLDLHASPARGKEQAKRLRRKRLEF